ncbi:MAG: hypothetical protein J6B06_01040 [Lachnospiraceae bacterium]|nr:hypothetical protein [Lachnospiraceae bacterium]
MEYHTREGKGSILIAEAGLLEENSYQMEMLRKNQLPGLLPVQVSAIDEQKEYYYEAGRLVPLAAYLEERTINVEMLQSYLESVRNVLASLEEYLLEPDCLCMKAEHIYIDEKEQYLRFCYGPCVQEQFQKGLLQLWQFFLQKLDYSDRQSVIMGYEIYQNIMREGYASAFAHKTYKKEEKAEEPEIVFPWEDEEDENDSLLPEERKLAEKIKLPVRWKLYAAGSSLCGLAAAFCYWQRSLPVLGLTAAAAAAALYVLIRYGRKDKSLTAFKIHGKVLSRTKRRRYHGFGTAGGDA